MTNKRCVLLGSTALAAIELLAIDVLAADGVELSIEGWYNAAAGGMVSEDFSASALVDESDLRDVAFKQYVGVGFSGETILDNGLVVGAYVELNGQTNDDQIRQVYAYFSSDDWGRIQFGDQDSALAAMCSNVPSAATIDVGRNTKARKEFPISIFGADSPAAYGFNFSNAGIAGYGATNGTCYGMDSYSTQLVYFSPAFSGFNFAVSFTPDQTEDTRNTTNGAGTRFENNAGQNSENLSMAAYYYHEFDDLWLTFGGAHTFSFDKEVNPNNTNEAQNSNAYFQVGFGGFTIGAAGEYRQNFFDDGADQLVYGAGVTYELKPWIFGLGWTRGDYEKAVGANGVGPFNAVYDDIALTLSYALGPGINLVGLVEYSHYRSNNAAGPDYDGLGLGVGTGIKF